MKKVSAIFYLCIVIASLVFGQSSEIHKGKINYNSVPLPSLHYQSEYTFDTPTDTLKWINEKPGLHISFASTDRLYYRSEVPELAEGESILWNETGWKGERLNTMILAWSPDTIEQVRFILNDLVNGEGKTISKENLKLDMVRYVVSNYPYGAKDAVCGESPYKDLYLLPDRFEKFDRFDLPGRTVRPVWLSVDIPAGTSPGIYKGTINVAAKNYTSTLNIELNVQNQLLPEPYNWKYRLDLWQNPWVVAWYYQLEPWSEEHKILLKKHLKLYADAGGKFITTYSVHSPWSDNSYMIEGAMIDWIKKADGSWKFDYNIFDKYIELAMETGIDKAITLYTPIPWGNRFRYMDEKTGGYVYETWEPGSVEFKTTWNIFLDDLKAHQEKKGWLDITYLGINENELSQTLEAIKVIKENSDKWKITYAGDWHAELDTLLDDYSAIFSKEPSMADVETRRSRGATSTYYVCCTPPVPNNFIFSPPAEGRWQGWYSAAYGYDGFLRWAYDAWPEDPVRDARHVYWSAGDCFLVYPGGNSGIRFEKMREGISDYEKIRILRELASESSDNNTKGLMKKFEDYLKTFTNEKVFDEEKIKKSLIEGRKMIADLTKFLSE